MNLGMKIFDLTRGKYPQMYDGPKMYDLDEFLPFVHSFVDNLDVVSLLINIPVFLVESTMGDEYISVPETGCSIRVPKDVNYCPLNKDLDIDEWVRSKESSYRESNEPTSVVISDLLGVYIFESNNALMPRKIFIWMDKIQRIVNATTTAGQSKSSNAAALFDLVLYHELSHGLMDVELYDKVPASNFNYSDYVYQCIEESYANAISLTILKKKGLMMQKSTEHFVKDFVLKQGAGYSDGWNLYLNNMCYREVEQWMYAKVLFNNDVAHQIGLFWLGNFKNLFFVKTVGHNGWRVVKDRYDKWTMTDWNTLKPVVGFKQYDSFWSFDEYGLCMVRINQEKGYLYGFVNESGVEQVPVQYDHIYGFDNGLAVAKKCGQYGVIDTENNVKIPFGLPYEEVRGFRKGRAAVKDGSGLWGVIDIYGNLIVPCVHENIQL